MVTAMEKKKSIKSKLKLKGWCAKAVVPNDDIIYPCGSIEKVKRRGRGANDLKNRQWSKIGSSNVK